MLVFESYPTLYDPMDYSSPVSSVCGILQARILVWIAIPFSRGSSRPRDRTRVSCIAGRFFTGCTTREACGGTQYFLCSVVQSCLTLCDPMDCIPPGTSVHGIPGQESWSGLPFLTPTIYPSSLFIMYVLISYSYLAPPPFSFPTGNY